MMDLMRVMKKRKSGFTLVELMVVVVIIGVLVAIAIPIFRGVQRNAAIKAHEANVRTLRGAASIALAEHGTPTALVTWSTDQAGTTPWLWADYMDDWPEDVPSILVGDTATPYVLTIAIDGGVTVTPGSGTYE